MKLILASSSPRRSEILREAGITFEACSTCVDETIHLGESAKSMVMRLAEAKARSGAMNVTAATTESPEQPRIVIGADTAVELDGQIFGKPRDVANAREMLTALSGRKHQVHTGIFLLRLPDGESRSAVEKTCVNFAALTNDEIETLIVSGEPFDKAGGYAIQGRAGRSITGIEGCYFNVVGLPLAKLYTLLRELGWTEEQQANKKGDHQGRPNTPIER